jgi:hypothetical protein
MRHKCFVVGLTMLTFASGASGQTPRQEVPTAYPLAMPKEYQELMTAMAAAQAKAVRPGDEAMACPALEKELVTLMTDPAIQAQAAKAEGLAQKRAVVPDPKAPLTPQSAAALYGLLAAGGGLPVIAAGGPLAAAQQAQLAQQQAQAMQALQDPAAQLKLASAIMPQMMRAQRLVGLGFARSCSWVLGAYTGMPPVQ